MSDDVHVCVQVRPWEALLRHPVRPTAPDSLFVNRANCFRPGTDKLTTQISAPEREL